MTEQKLAKLAVWWSSEWKSWGVLRFDAEENQIGEGEWHAYKADAVLRAREVAFEERETLGGIRVEIGTRGR